MSRLTIDVVDGQGREIALDVTIRRDTVEFFAEGRCWAAFDRELLGSWLSQPEGVLAVDDITWQPAGESVGLTVHSLVPWWPLTAQMLNILRFRMANA